LIAFYVTHKGTCLITEEDLFLNDFHCHHKETWILTQNDSYRNLVLVQKEAHTLIHATKPETIQRLLKPLSLSSEKLEKLNKLRKLVKNDEIPISTTEPPIEQIVFF